MPCGMRVLQHEPASCKPPSPSLRPFQHSASQGIKVTNSQAITIALAQLPVTKAAVDDNLQTHLAYIERAAALGANVVAFPELSLTGYELALLSQLAMPRDDAAFATLTAAAVANNTVVIAGCPLHNPHGKPYIAAVICFPNGEHTFCLKQHLHKGEEVYCAPGTESGLINVNDTRIALAVCADFTHPSHAATAAAQQADVYLASALISPRRLCKKMPSCSPPSRSATNCRYCSPTTFPPRAAGKPVAIAAAGTQQGS